MKTSQAGSAAPKHCKAAEELRPLQCPSTWLLVPGTTEGRELAVPNVLISRSAWKNDTEKICVHFLKMWRKSPHFWDNFERANGRKEKKKVNSLFQRGSSLLLCLLSNPEEGKAPGDAWLAGSCSVLIRASPALLAAWCPCARGPWPSCSQPWQGEMHEEREGQQYHSTWDAVPHCHWPCPLMRQGTMHWAQQVSLSWLLTFVELSDIISKFSQEPFLNHH